MQKKIFKEASFFSFLFYLVFFLGIHAKAQKFAAAKIKSAVYSIKIFPATGNTFGYEILRENTVIIRQSNIPGIPGLKGFRRKGDAHKVATFAVSKISRGIMPPTIEKIDLDKLNIHY